MVSRVLSWAFVAALSSLRSLLLFGVAVFNVPFAVLCVVEMEGKRRAPKA